ncbi:hypothetical protein [Agrobacterium tumefaciens]|uniref:hypothetical protein n=1 Tax=Agrobacterium tumefaciens TaxID=358 RepID=UPI003A521502
MILLCVRWYLAYNLSLRDLDEMMAERGIAVAGLLKASAETDHRQEKSILE